MALDRHRDQDGSSRAAAPRLSRECASTCVIPGRYRHAPYLLRPLAASPRGAIRRVKLAVIRDAAANLARA